MEIRRIPEWVKTEYDLEVYHSGIIGQKWGKRRYQNSDGSLTPLGRVHYGYGPARATDAGRTSNATGIARKAGTSSHVQRAFRSNDSNYTLVSTDTRAPSRGGKDKKLDDYLDRNLSDTYSKLEYTIGTMGTAGEHLKKLSDNGMHWYETTHVHSKLNDEDIDGLRDSEVALIGANYLHTSPRQTHTMTKSRANRIGSGDRTNYDALSPYAASRNGNNIRDSKDWQDANIESYNRLTNNGKNLPKSWVQEDQYTSNHIKLRDEIYNEKKRRR